MSRVYVVFAVAALLVWGFPAHSEDPLDPNFLVLTMETFGPPGSGSTEPAGVKLISSANQAIPVSAVPASGFLFSSWILQGMGTIEDAKSASTNVTLTGNAVVTAVFVAQDAPMTAMLKVSSAVDATGTVTPADPVELPVGQTQAVTAVAAAGYRFAYWRLDGPAFIGNKYSSATQVIIAGPALLVAYFLEDDDVVELQIEAGTGGNVSAPGTYYVPKGGARSISALPLPDFIFTGWELDGVADMSNKYSPETEIIPYEDTKITATFKEYTCPFSHKARKIFIRTSGSYLRDCDNAVVRSLPMCLTPENFNPNNDTLRVIIDGSVFTIDKQNGLFKRFASGYKYKSFSKIPNISLTLDFTKGVWSFWGRKLQLSTLDNRDGVDVILECNGIFYGKNYNMDESARWNFTNTNSTSSTLASAATPMTSFNILRLSSRISNSRNLGDFLSIGSAVLQLQDESLDIAATDVTLTVGGEAIIIPRGQFVKTGTGRYAYIGKTKDHKLQMKLDIARRHWSMFLSKFSGWGTLDQSEPVRIFLTVGPYQSGLEAYPAIRRTLKYDYNKIYWSSKR